MFKFRKIWQKLCKSAYCFEIPFYENIRLRIGSENIDVKMETLEMKIAKS